MAKLLSADEGYRRRPCRAAILAAFVDDRLDVLGHLTTVEHRYRFTGGLGDHEPPAQVPGWAIAVETWPRLVGLLERDLHHDRRADGEYPAPNSDPI